MTMKNRECDDKMIDCCPLCQCDEFFISDNDEKFICRQCGFITQKLGEVHAQIKSTDAKFKYYIHKAQTTIH